MINIFLEAALAFAAKDVPVFPCQNKEPLTPSVLLKRRKFDCKPSTRIFHISFW